MFKILKMFTDYENPETGSINGKAFESLSKSECLKIISRHGVDRLELCRMGHIIDPSPKFLSKLAYFTDQVCPEAGGTGGTSKTGEQVKKKPKRQKRQR